MERAEAMFTGSAKSKIIAEIHFDNDPDTSYKVIYANSVSRSKFDATVLMRPRVAENGEKGY